ncbi:nucleoside-diphosphate sugar epimerase [Salinarchaeum sp. Harcht-Bsk1]|uniref:NAD(P)H-binding protein n=1 Tax=Salinarchaeum sp. Harcht-Bsk1 TaxID=1333523 RepID=UPI0003424765|nr:NAD(P)H-binding protein [Salinarchaeum sp. Harcht-Bsk1]AGN01536.1 nucleoside-diphosphate sugar epimerase [Salinarchaeum sp. Harcht-Bsk1]
MHVLLTGATGFVGRHLLPELRDRGHQVTALVRDRSAVTLPDDVRVIEGDLQEPAAMTVFEPAPEATAGGDDVAAASDAAGEPGATETTFADAIAGCDAAYYLIHSMRAGEDFEALDRDLAQGFADAASAAGIERVIYLGGLGEGTGSASGDGDADARGRTLEDLSPHLRSRREVEAILAEGDYELTTLRAAIIIGKGSAGFEIVRQLSTKLPVMVTPSWVRTPCQPIAIADAVAYLAGVLDAPETAGGTYGIGGPEVLPYEEMLRRVGRILGGGPIIVPVPVLSPKLSSYWVGLVTDVDASIARPLIEGLRTPVVVEDPAIDEYVDVEKTPFDEAVRRALAEAGP